MSKELHVIFSSLKYTDTLLFVQIAASYTLFLIKLIKSSDNLDILNTFWRSGVKVIFVYGLPLRFSNN